MQITFHSDSDIGYSLKFIKSVFAHHIFQQIKLIEIIK